MAETIVNPKTIDTLNEQIATINETINERITSNIEEIVISGAVSIPCGGYGFVIIGGILQQVGNVVFAVSLYNGVVGIYNLVGGSPWTNTNAFNVWWSNGMLTVNATHASAFRVLKLAL